MTTTKLLFVLFFALLGIQANANSNLSSNANPETIIVLTGYGGATTVGIGQQLEIDAFFIPADQAKALNWTINNTQGEATLESGQTHCIITGVKAGVVTITATVIDDTLSASIDIEIVNSGSEVWVNSIIVQGQAEATSITTPGGTLQMEAQVFPANATDSTFTWSVENQTGAATISATGLLTAVSDGIVRVKATANDASQTVGYADITINQVTAVFDENIEDLIGLSPNPASKVLNISKTGDKPVNLSIIDISGKVVKQFNLKNNNQAIDVSDLQRGVYFINILVNKHQSIQKKLILVD